MEKYILISVVAFFVSVVSSIAGGGGGLVMTPLMLLLGFPPQVALASAKAGGLGINIGALTKFTRHKGLIHRRWALVLALCGIVASIIGTRLVFVLHAYVLKDLIVVITLSLVPFLVIRRKKGLRVENPSKVRQGVGAALYFVILVAQAGLGSGIGIVTMLILTGMLGLDALHASATKRAAGLVLAATSFTIFAFSSYMNWALALALGLGMIVGGYVGARLAIKHGNRLIESMLLVLAVAMAIGVLIKR